MGEGWDPLVDDLRARRDRVSAMGGAENLERQRAGGRLDARARVDALLDPGTFVELGALVGSVHRGVIDPVPADGLVAGHGLVDGRPVLVGAEDFSVLGGTIGLGTAEKRRRLVDLSEQERVPLVLLLESAGERGQNQFERRARTPGDLQALARLSGSVPLVGAVMGAVAGHSALTAPLLDFVVMVEGAALFASGPPAVLEATGQEVDREELGGTAIHTTVSAVVHNAAPDDRAALVLLRHYLSYLPTNAWEHPPATPAGPDADPRRLDELAGVLPADARQPYDVHAVLDLVVDTGSVLEVQPAFGRAVVTALARLGGEAVAIVANQPAVAGGAIDADAADKAAHFLEVADAFHLPVVFLADTAGIPAGTAAERDGILRHAARMFAAQAAISSPKLHVTLRRAYGFGGALMALQPFDAQTVALALPGARLGPVPGGGDPGDSTALLEHGELGGAYAAADTMRYDEVVEPAELRDALLAALRLTAARRRSQPQPVVRRGIRP